MGDLLLKDNRYPQWRGMLGAAEDLHRRYLLKLQEGCANLPQLHKKLGQNRN